MSCWSISRPKKLTGKAAEVALGRANITCNKNGVPFDPEKPMVTSGIRFGSPAGTTRGITALPYVVLLHVNCKGFVKRFNTGAN